MESNHPVSPTPPPAAPVHHGAHPHNSPHAPAAPVSKGLAITALVLSITSVVIGLAWFVAAPLAIAAIVLAIVALVKKKAGTGMSIASLIVGGVSLFILVPFWVIVTVLAFNDLQFYMENQGGSSEYRTNSETYDDTPLFEN